MVSGSATSTASLQSLPQELLRHILVLCCETPEQLFAAGSLCRGLRAAASCPAAVQLRPLWTRIIIALVDPAAALSHGPGLQIYSEHASRRGLVRARARAGAAPVRLLRRRHTLGGLARSRRRCAAGARSLPLLQHVRA
jgi:hypothetical protein